MTDEINELTSGKSVTTKEEEIKTLEKEYETATHDCVTSINKLPLVKNEVTETITNEDGTTTTTTSTSTTTSSVSGTNYPGTVTSVTIKGNIGGASSTTTTSSSTSDVTTHSLRNRKLLLS